MGGLDTSRYSDERAETKMKMVPPTHISIDTKKRSSHLSPSPSPRINKENFSGTGNIKSRGLVLGKGTGSGGNGKNNNHNNNGNGGRGGKKGFWKKLTNKKKKKRSQQQANNSSSNNSNSQTGTYPTKPAGRRASQPVPAPDLNSFLEQDEEDDEVRTLHTASMTASHGGQSKFSLTSQSRTSSLTTSSTSSPSRSKNSLLTSSKHLEAGYPSYSGDGDDDGDGDENDIDTYTYTSSSLPSSPTPLVRPQPVHPHHGTNGHSATSTNIFSPTRIKSTHSVSFADDPPESKRTIQTTAEAVATTTATGPISPSSPGIQLGAPKLKRSYVSRDEENDSEEDSAFAISMQRYHDLFRNKRVATGSTITSKSASMSLPLRTQKSQSPSHKQFPLYETDTEADDPSPDTFDISDNNNQGLFEEDEQEMYAEERSDESHENIHLKTHQSHLPSVEPASDPLSTPASDRHLVQPISHSNTDSCSVESYTESLDHSDHAVHLDTENDSFHEDLLSFEPIPQELSFDMKEVLADAMVDKEELYSSEEEMSQLQTQPQESEEPMVIIENLKTLIENGFDLDDKKYHTYSVASQRSESEMLSSVSTVNSLAKHQLHDDSVEIEVDSDDELDIPLTILDNDDAIDPIVHKDLMHIHNIFDKVEKKMKESSTLPYSSSNRASVQMLSDKPPTSPSSAKVTTTKKTTTTTTTTTTTRKKLTREDSGGWIPNGALAIRMADEHSSHTSSSSSVFSFTSEDFAENDVHEREIMQQYSSRSLQITTIVEETEEGSEEVVSRTSTCESVSVVEMEMDVHEDEGDENQFIDVILDRLDAEADVAEAIIEKASDGGKDLLQTLPSITPSPSKKNKIANVKGMRTLQKTVSWKEKPKVHLFEPDYEVSIEMALSLVRSYDPRYTNKKVGLGGSGSNVRKPLYLPKKGVKPLPSILKSGLYRSSSAPPALIEDSGSDSDITPPGNEPTQLDRRSDLMDPMAFQATRSLPFTGSRSLSSDEFSDDSPVDEKYQINNRSFINLPPSPLVRSASDPHSSSSRQSSMEEFFHSNSTSGSRDLMVADTASGNIAKSSSDISWDPSQSAPSLSGQFSAVVSDRVDGTSTRGSTSKAISSGSYLPPSLTQVDGTSTRSMSSSSASRAKSSGSSLPSTLSYASEGLHSPYDLKSSDEDSSLLSISSTTSDSVKYMVEKLHKESDRRRRKAKSKRSGNASCFPSCYTFDI